MTAKRVLRTVAFSTAILLVLLPFQTAILSSENNPSNTSVVPAKRGSSAPLISIRGGTLNLNEPEETATATLRLSFSSEENDIVVIVEHDSDGTRATAVFHASFDSTEYCAHILSYHTFGRIACSGGAESTYSNTYIGEFRDASVSLNYFGERFYDPGIGRFVSMDTVLGAPQMPQSLNRYAYAINNPLKNADPSGEFFLSWIGAIVGGIIGAVAYTVTTLVTGQDWDWSAFGRSVAVGVIAGAITATCGICGSGLWANIAGGAAIGAGIGALGYAADRGIEYLQTGTLEWDWGQFGLSVGIGAAAGAAGGYMRWRSLQKPAATPVKGSTAARETVPGTPDDILASRARLQGIVDDVNAEGVGLTEPQLRAGPRAAHYGTQLHAEVAERVAHDPFLGGRLTYVGAGKAGPDFAYRFAKNVFFEVTTPGQIGAHSNRFMSQGINGFFWFITYVRP